MKKLLAVFALCMLGNPALADNQQDTIKADQLASVGGGCDPAICGSNGLSTELLNSVVEDKSKETVNYGGGCDPAICGSNGLNPVLLESL